jgi:hypothetical protein
MESRLARFDKGVKLHCANIDATVQLVAGGTDLGQSASPGGLA